MSDPRVLRPAAPAQSLQMNDEALFRVWVKEVDSEFTPSSSQAVFTHSDHIYCTQLEADFDEPSSQKGEEYGIDINNISSVLDINLVEKEVSVEKPAIVDWDEAI